MRILVTGGNGFIGKHVCKILPKDAVVCSPRSIEVNILDKEAIDNILKKFMPTHCLHLAWAIKGDYVISPANLEWLESGKYLIREFYKHGGQRFVGCGSCYEYKPSECKHNEDDASDLAPTTYGKAKYYLGKFLQNFAEKNNYSWAWGRPFFLTGPGENAQRFIPSMIKDFMSGNDFEMRHSERFLDYLDVRDVARAFSVILTSWRNGIYNICSGVCTSTVDIANIVKSSGNFPGNIIGSFNICEPVYCSGNNNKLINDFNFFPKYNLNHTINECVVNYQHKG